MISTPRIDISLVRRLVGAQFPQWDALGIEPVEIDGWDNRTFRLGDDMTVRLPSAKAYAAQVAKEHRWLPRLALLLPLPIPTPLAMGSPAEDYPWHWSIYRWLDGANATTERIADMSQFAIALAGFLVALQSIAPDGGPPPGEHNFHRGGALAVYDAETRRAIETLRGTLDTSGATDAWEAALDSQWHAPPVWVHGDFGASNMLVNDGRLSAVIDFGSSAVGDPACDLTIAWTMLSENSRDAFRSALSLDEAAWARARGWALWKGLITMADAMGTDSWRAAAARHVVDEVLAEHERAA